MFKIVCKNDTACMMGYSLYYAWCIGEIDVVESFDSYTDAFIALNEKYGTDNYIIDCDN